MRRWIMVLCALAERAFQVFDEHPEFEAVTRNLSICTFRYVPRELRGDEAALDTLNRAILAAIEAGGKTFLSQAVVDGRFLLRMCVVNFRTAVEDIEALPAIVAEAGARVSAGWSAASLAG